MAGDDVLVNPETLNTAGTGFSTAAQQVNQLLQKLNQMKAGQLDNTWQDEAKTKFDQIHQKHSQTFNQTDQMLKEISGELKKLAQSYPQTSRTAAGQLR